MTRALTLPWLMLFSWVGGGGGGGARGGFFFFGGGGGGGGGGGMIQRDFVSLGIGGRIF